MANTSAIETKNVAIVQEFLEAWAAGDAEGVVGLFAEDAVFSASVGPEPGKTLTGRDKIAPAVSEMLKAAAGSKFAITEINAVADGAVVTWTQTGVSHQGRSFNIKGIDVFKVKGELVTLKNAYRKVEQS
ncbi:nuclear transport factor 2 family protein [Paraburkholderia sp.]|uniref:nuclear transport factor 2 family protein n=1 Tax=Paraburkholderia sp. TaxID=1926495 RepID=UPI003C79B861